MTAHPALSQSGKAPSRARTAKSQGMSNRPLADEGKAGKSAMPTRLTPGSPLLITPPAQPALPLPSPPLGPPPGWKALPTRPKPAPPPMSSPPAFAPPVAMVKVQAPMPFKKPVNSVAPQATHLASRALVVKTRSLADVKARFCDVRDWCRLGFYVGFSWFEVGYRYHAMPV